ncbi:MAG TPA: hypothetical protein PLE19_03895 [Planctomycetota bacterium]|nr:hypothetical protein [Planctomycetota bacterium]HRR78558.1 hypothetical protein [Planctomycetota bacterium]HRT94813.1 hypothetical protein [Planctomycetota bacterium]
MRTHGRAWRLLATSLVLALAPAAAAAAAGEGTTYWSLSFENDTPKQLVLEDAGGKLRFFWYLVYRVKNPEAVPLPARLRLTMKLAIEKQSSDYDDGFDRVAETHLEEKVLERKVNNWAELRAEPLQPGETREGLAIFAVGREAPDFDKMTIAVHGLAELRPLGREGNVRKFRERVLLLRYEQVSSRWRAGKELKYLPEEWSLEEISVADRGAPEGAEGDKLREKLDEALKKAREEQQRREKIIQDQPPPPPKASEGPGDAPLVGAGPPSGRPAPELLQAVRKAALAAPRVRATLMETVGLGERKREATCTALVDKSGKFAIERQLNPGTEQALQEHRVFDAQHLWIQTTAKGVGDAVRRWTAAATKKEWYAVDGKPEVDFATVANPVRAWCLFGDDLVYLGTERLGREAAYVFEIQPGPKFEAVLSGPLSGEVLGKAMGRRVRFWLGSASGFQLKMQVYDERGQSLASLECRDLALDAAIPPESFVFRPAAGVEVVDMNASLAANDKP